MNQSLIRQFRLTLLTLLTAATLVTPIFLFATDNENRPVAKAGWTWTVHHSDLKLVDNLAIDRNEVLYATLEQGSGRGKVIAITDGKARVLVGDLDRPDGLMLDGDTLFITEEVIDGRVLSYHLKTGQLQLLARLHKPEGITRLANGDLVLAEDVNGGRLLRLSREGQFKVLTAGLRRPEGIRATPDDTIYIAETGTGRVLAYDRGKVTTLIEDLNKPDQLAIAPDASLWIAEDSNPGRILRYRAGKLEVIVENLASPQGMVFDRQGGLYVAEQHRHRILYLIPSAAQ